MSSVQPKVTFQSDYFPINTAYKCASPITVFALSVLALLHSTHAAWLQNTLPLPRRPSNPFTELETCTIRYIDSSCTPSISSFKDGSYLVAWNCPPEVSNVAPLEAYALPKLVGSEIAWEIFPPIENAHL